MPFFLKIGLKNAMNFYPHHIGDFRSGTINMTRLERWIYRDMLDVYYDKELPFPLDHQEVCDCVGVRTDEECKVVAYLLRLKFQKMDNGYFHDRCDAEISSYHQKAETARSNGKAGGRPKKPIILKPIDNQPGFYEEPGRFPIGTGLKTNQEPVTSNQEPRTKNQEPEKQPQLQPLPEAVPASAPAKRVRKPSKAEPGTGKVWVAYATAYWNRYGVEPVRNAMVNGQLSNLVKRIGVDDAEHVASFFIGHQHRYYVEKMHAVGLMLADCEKLRTEWATSTQMTSTKAVQQDRTQTNYDAFAPLIAEARAREMENAE